MRGLQQVIMGLGFVALTACSKQPPVLTTPSGGEPGYAEQYPTRLGALRAGFDADEAKVQAALPQLEPAAQKLGSADPTTLEQLFELADAEGQSRAYARQAQETETVARFWDEEKQPLHQKIAGGVSYAAKQKSCTSECGDDLANVAAGSADRAVEKQLEERQQRLGEIHRFVEDHEEALGKANADAAEKQAQALALMSHLVHVRLELYRRELEATLNDQSDVRATLERSEKESNAVLADGNASRSQRALAERRKASAEAARAALDGEVAQAKQALKDMPAREQKLSDDYAKALAALKASLRSRSQK